jgi:epoxyqueuosine reductase QueG
VREALAGTDARTLAREILTMDVDAYRAAFRGSPMKRAKLPAIQRNAAIVLGTSARRRTRTCSRTRWTTRTRSCASMRRGRSAGSAAVVMRPNRARAGAMQNSARRLP